MIEVKGLSKRYGSVLAVDQASFTCEPGQVTGFLGPNGAGKSTTLRMLVGHTTPTSGEAYLLGRSYHQLPNPGRSIGVLLDAGAQHVGRTGREVLSLSALTMGLPKTRVEEMLELVGLTPAEAKQRLGAYSLGMRQRLGIANAMLGDPKVVILDEPANGLDPEGIRWMRDLLRHFASQGRTVLLSSHLLHEVDQMADHIVVIGKGRVVASGPKGQLLSGSAATRVRGLDSAATEAALTKSGMSWTKQEDTFVVEAKPEELGKLALDFGLVLTELQAHQAGLEALFFELTSDTQRDSLSAGPGTPETGSQERSA